MGGKNEFNKMACIYLLLSKSTNKFYIGSSRENLANKRLVSHNSEKTRSTKFGRPWKLVYEENFLEYTEARKRELFLKTGVGRKWVTKNFGYLKTRDWQQGGGVARVV